MFGPHWQVIIRVAEGAGCTEGLAVADGIVEFSVRD
jgi:hypothetical protein